MARHMAAVALLAVLVASCGGDDESTSDIDAGDPSTVSPASRLDSAVREEIVGDDAVLVVDGETRATELVRSSDSAARPAVVPSPSLPGEGPLINITGVLAGPGRWVVSGNDCGTVEVVDPAGCTPGTLTLAVLEGDTWFGVEGLPDEFTKAFVSARSASNGRVLLERWDRGDSRYWLLDVEARRLEPIAWSPEPLEPGDSLVVDSEMNVPESTRMACLVENSLLVMEAQDGARFQPRITVVNVTRPSEAAVVASDSEALTETSVLMPPVCEEGRPPFLIATTPDGDPFAYEIALADATVGPAIPSGLGGGVPAAITYGPGTVALQIVEPGTSDGPDATVPAGSDASEPSDARVEPARRPARVAVFRDGRWQRPPSDAMVTSDQVVLPLGSPDPPLIVVNRQDDSYRLIDAGQG